MTNETEIEKEELRLRNLNSKYLLAVHKRWTTRIQTLPVEYPGDIPGEDASRDDLIASVLRIKAFWAENYKDKLPEAIDTFARACFELGHFREILDRNGIQLSHLGDIEGLMEQTAKQLEDVVRKETES